MINKNAMIVGGSNGIGLALTHKLLNEGYNKIYVADKAMPDTENEKIEYIYVDLTDCDYEIFKKYMDIDTLIITAGFGRAALFETIEQKEIENSFKVNSAAVAGIIKAYYEKLKSKDDFYCMVMGSIAGLISSPLFSLYAATKAAVCRFIESINIELEKSGSNNRILNVSPGSLNGTRFNGKENQIELLAGLTSEIIIKMRNREQLFIPDYENVYKNVLDRYNSDPHKFGIESYDYKINSGRINNNPQIKVGYLSGTFDLFHIGHLNLLKRAKKYCDYLIVGVHKDASHKGKDTYIPYEERKAILESIKYVDKVILAKYEDMDVYNDFKYDFLFVGSDYKGTARFKRYEEFFADKNVKIIYFPYTKGTSSTQLRAALDKSRTGE